MKTKEIWKAHPGSQQLFQSCPVWECLLHGSRGGGKAIKSDTYVISDKGKIKLKDLKLTDKVFGRDGNLYNVTGIFPQGYKEQYKIEFKDKRYIYCDIDHKWTVFYNNYREKVVTVKEMITNGLFIGNKKYNNYRFKIPLCKPVNFNKKHLINPFFSGELINKKCIDFVQEDIKYSSIKQRGLFLKGLFGKSFFDREVVIKFDHNKKQLVKDIAWVCHSLGINCTIEYQKMKYSLYIYPNAQKYVSIVSIIKEKTKVHMTCISVDSPDHTFITKDFLVTHNTDALLMDYLSGVGIGYGIDYKGLLLREATTELGDVISKCKKWIPKIFPSAKYNASKKIWAFEGGETLWLNYARVEDDYEQYHGHEYCLLDTTRVLLPNNKYNIARNIKVGDLVQTLKGPKKVTKVLQYKKAGVTISALDEDSRLIGTQQQGLIHPVLTTSGWQRLGLSCLFQTSEQSVIGKIQIEEVLQFLFGVHQEILEVLQKNLYLGVSHSISVSISKWYSCLYQIFHQFLRLTAPAFLKRGFPLYKVLENQGSYYWFEKFLEICSEEFEHERPKYLQLLRYCFLLINVVQKIQLNHVHRMQSILYYTFGSSFLLKIQKYLNKQQLFSSKHLDFFQVYAISELILHQNVLNGVYLGGLFGQHIIQDCLGGNQEYFYSCDEQLLALSMPSAKQFPLFADGSISHPFQCTDQGYVYPDPYSLGTFSKISQPFDKGLLSFSASSFSSPINMVDFEIEDAHHYISCMDNNIGNKNSQVKKDICLINQNCWIGWEELTNHPFDTIYLKLMSCNRTSNKEIPLKYRATCNPSGPGHCVPYGDVLTPIGWRDIKDIKVNDAVFTISKYGCMQETRVAQVHKSYYDGSMVTVHKQNIHMECTLDHSIPQFSNDGLELIPFKDLSENIQIVGLGTLNSITKSKDSKINNFKGNIYCLGIEDTHTFVLRQKGSIWISGNSWVKSRFIDRCAPGALYTDEYGQTRTHIQSFLSENKTMLEADPAYEAKLMALTDGNKMLRDAWIHGSWNLLAGGFFIDVWDPKTQILPDFDLPKSWKIVRSFDWGSSRPWAVTYGAVANGEQPITDIDDFPHIPKGSVIIIDEIYGWTGEVNTGDRATSQVISERILGMDAVLRRKYGINVISGPADTQIWEVKDGSSIANSMSTFGCRWVRAYKGPGSRIAGWAIIRQMLTASKKQKETARLYFLQKARHHIRTLPLLQRDKKNPDDLDSNSEDHCFVYDTKIITSKGTEKIGDLVGKVGKVLSVNGEFVNFKNCREIKSSKPLVKVSFNDGHCVVCTEDHKFLTTKGFVEAKDLFSLNYLCIISKKKKCTCLLNVSIKYNTVLEKKSIPVYAEKNGILQIKSVQKLNTKGKVYCLEAERTHTFALENGVIVSNCGDSLRYLLTRKLTTIRRRKVGI